MKSLDSVKSKLTVKELSFLHKHNLLSDKHFDDKWFTLLKNWISLVEENPSFLKYPCMQSFLKEENLPGFLTNNLSLYFLMDLKRSRPIYFNWIFSSFLKNIAFDPKVFDTLKNQATYYSSTDGRFSCRALLTHMVNYKKPYKEYCQTKASKSIRYFQELLQMGNLQASIEELKEALRDEATASLLNSKRFDLKVYTGLLLETDNPEAPFEEYREPAPITSEDLIAFLKEHKQQSLLSKLSTESASLKDNLEALLQTNLKFYYGKAIRQYLDTHGVSDLSKEEKELLKQVIFEDKFEINSTFKSKNREFCYELLEAYKKRNGLVLEDDLLKAVSFLPKIDILEAEQLINENKSIEDYLPMETPSYTRFNIASKFDKKKDVQSVYFPTNLVLKLLATKETWNGGIIFDKTFTSVLKKHLSSKDYEFLKEKPDFRSASARYLLTRDFLVNPPSCLEDLIELAEKAIRQARSFKGTFEARDFCPSRLLMKEFVAKRMPDIKELSYDKPILEGVSPFNLKGFSWDTYEELCSQAKIDPYFKLKNKNSTSNYDKDTAVSAKKLVYFFGSDLTFIEKFVNLRPDGKNTSFKKKLHDSGVLISEENLRAIPLEDLPKWRLFVKQYPELVLAVASKAFIYSRKFGVPSSKAEFEINCSLLNLEENDPKFYNLARYCDQLELDDYEYQKIKKVVKTLEPKGKNNIEFKAISSEGYTARLLEPKDYRALMIGYESGCCQHILEGHAQNCAKFSYCDPEGGVLVIENKEGKLLAQSFVWRGNLDSSKKMVVIDSIESLMSREVVKVLAPLYKKTIQQLKANGYSVQLSTSDSGFTSEVVCELKKEPNLKLELRPTAKKPLKNSKIRLVYTDCDSHSWTFE